MALSSDKKESIILIGLKDTLLGERIFSIISFSISNIVKHSLHEAIGLTDE